MYDHRMSHPSDSADQRAAERTTLLALEALWAARFTPGTRLPVDVGLAPDGVDLDRKLVVEVYARVGRLKPAQAHKVKADLFKLAYLRKLLGPDWRVVFCFVDQEAAALLMGKSWAAQAAQAFGVEVVVHELPGDMRERVETAQARQRMTNATPG